MDNFCRHCDVKVKSYLKNCPLCGRFIEGNDGKTGDTVYPYYLEKKDSWGINILGKISVIAIPASLVINILLLWFLNKKFIIQNFWSVYIIIGIAVFLCSVYLPIKRKRYKFKEFSIFLVSVILAAVLYDYITDLAIDWSLFYVIPAIISLASMVLFFFSLLRKRGDTANAFLTMLILFFSGVIIAVIDTVLVKTKVLNGNILPLLIMFGFVILAFSILIVFKFREYIKNLIKKLYLRQ